MKWTALALIGGTYCWLLFTLAERHVAAAEHRLHVYLTQQQFDLQMVSNRIIYEP
jgi:hypothetical protein